MVAENGAWLEPRESGDLDKREGGGTGVATLLLPLLLPVSMVLPPSTNTTSPAFRSTDICCRKVRGFMMPWSDINEGSEVNEGSTPVPQLAEVDEEEEDGSSAACLDDDFDGFEPSLPIS